MAFSQPMARAQSVVVPNGSAGVEGTSGNGYPFNITAFGHAQQRYQQVYLSSQFPAGPLTITSIAFRPDAGAGGAFAATLPSIQIDLSTTSGVPDGLSLTYAANVGANDTVVYGPAPLSLSSSFTGPPGGPKNFDIVINLTTPFVYNPAAGNLLMDVRNFGGGTTTFFDATNAPGIISRVYNEDGNVNATMGTPEVLGAGYGLVTQFGFASVPEPGTFALVGASALAMMGYTWHRRRHAKRTK
jgi:hypothetical protein